MIKHFRLPDPGEGLVEADIVTWRVSVGDAVKVNDILLEVETSKSLVELPSPYAGTVTELLVAEGDTVDVGRPVIAIDDGVAEAPAAAPAGNGSAAASDGGRVPNLVGYGPREGSSQRRARKAPRSEPVEASHEQVAHTFDVDAPVSRRADERAPLQPEPVVPVGDPLPEPGVAPTEPGPDASSVLAKPPVRKLAKDLGLDLRTVTGTGEGGVITREDVTSRVGDRSSDEVPTPSPAPAAPASGETRIPIKGVRKATAQAMVDSAFTAPHVSVWVTCDVTATMELIERLKGRREFRDLKLTPLLIIAKAVCLALQRNPDLNSTWDEARQEIVQKHDVNLGIAAATPRGLMVPNVKAAQQLSLLDLATALNAVIAKAREGRSQPADLSGGSFTITNVGVFGIDAGTPILNPGEAGILCVGQITRRPWVLGSGDDERIEPRWVTTLAVSFDHRLADGEQGSRFLSAIAQILGDPGLALLY